jgi:WD40 repeat protein
LQVFDASNGTLNWTNTDFEHPISTIVFSRDGKHLAVGGQDSELRVFSTERGATVARVKLQWRDDCKESKAPCAVWGMSFSMDGNYVVLSGTDKTARVMDVAHNMEFRVVELPASALYAILSVDDRFMATASQDLMGRVFDVASSREVWHMPLPQGAFFPVAFTDEDKYVVLMAGSHEMEFEPAVASPGSDRSGVYLTGSQSET